MAVSETQGQSRQRVLLVDDSRLIRFAGKRYLSDEFDVVLAEDGVEAWDRIQNDPTIRILITDLMMPRIDGHELIRRVRESESRRIRDLPILVITSMEEAAGRRRAIGAGASDLVAKPFTAADILEPARSYLAKGRPARRAPVKPTHPVLPNIEHERGEFINRLEQSISFHRRQRLDLTLLHIRLDNYRHVANRYGATWAESAMRHLGRTIAHGVRREDTLFRGAGHVYSALLMGTPELGAKRLRERLRRKLDRIQVRFPGQSLDLAVSFSIQPVDPHAEDTAEQMLDGGLRRLDRPANVTPLHERR
ncbi:MAG: response regulator [Wenzhouxiangellaceae bacterium]|nr:response regulator [Wenzhouxiangellaceae bacterium]